MPELRRSRPQGLRAWAHDEPLPARLHWTAEYFVFSGYAGFVGMAAATVATIAGFAPLRSMFVAHPGGFLGRLALGAVCATGWLLTGRALRARRRIGGWFALGTLLPSLFYSVSAGPAVGTGLVISALGTIAILTSWRELE